MYDRISSTYIRPLPSKLTPTGSSISGSVSTGSIVKPGGSTNVCCSASGDWRTTGGRCKKSAPGGSTAPRPPCGAWADAAGAAGVDEGAGGGDEGAGDWLRTMDPPSVSA